MKILCLLMCVVVLSSCATQEALTFPIDSNVEFTDGTLTVEGRLFFDKEKMLNFHSCLYIEEYYVLCRVR